jgi:hypothetical protein
MLSSHRRSSLLLIVGILLLVNPYAPGLHLGDGSVHRYEAATVTYNESAGLHVTDPETGRELSPSSVDDDIICTGSIGRVCQFEYAVYEGTNVSATPGEYADYQFVYLNETLYRPTTVPRERQLRMSLDRVTGSDPLRDVATSGGLSEGARSVISTGSVLTYRELPEEGTLVRHDGQYYTLYEAGVKHYGGGGSFCGSSGDGFCGAADSKRWVDSLLTLGSWGIGAALVVFAFRSRDPA